MVLCWIFILNYTMGTTGGFELGTSYKERSYLSQYAIALRDHTSNY